MKVKDILKALEGAPADADVTLAIRSLKVTEPKKTVAEKKAVANPKPATIKKPEGKAVKPTNGQIGKSPAKKPNVPKPVAKKPVVATAARVAANAKKKIKK